MIGIVVVSHSRPLAEAAVALAVEMTPQTARPRIAVAAGLGPDTFGTDAVAIGEAIAEVDSPDGVLVLLDLGSALLSAELAVELAEPQPVGTVRLTAAPLVEGLVAAVVTASAGNDLEQVAVEAENGLAAKQEHLGAPAPAAGSDEVWAVQPQLTVRHQIRNRHGLHARPAAALVTGLRGLDATVRLRNLTTGKGPVDAGSITRVAALGLRHGASLEATFAGPQAAAAQARFQELAANDFGEPHHPGPGAVPGGTGTGREVVLAPAAVRSGEVNTGDYQPSDPATETARLAAATAEVRRWLARLAQSPAERDIFEAQQALLSDPELAEQLTGDTRSGTTAVDAVRQRLDEVAADFDALSDPYLRERGQDLRSLRRLLLLALTGASEPDPARAHILVVDELDAATAARLHPDLTLGVVTLTGGPTGHGVIVAGSRGIPVLPGCQQARQARDGDLIGFDPTTQQWWLRPGPELVAEIQDRGAARARELEAAALLAHEPAVTTTGIGVLVECNVGSLDDARRGAAAGADGSGLVRTEIVFADTCQAPDAGQQAEVLVAIGEILGRPITVRTWDPGPDKPLAFVTAGRDPNPMLGERGIRAVRRQPELLRTQLRGILLAARQVPVRVLLPMISEPAQVRWARELLEQVRAELTDPPPLPLGIMVEVPAAALRAADFAGLVDFVSIGTNDLSQYTMAADRGNERVRDLVPAGTAAVWDLVEATCRGLAGIPVGVCGDLASDPDQVSALISRGVTELSVQPPLVGLVKQAVRRA